MSYKFKDTLVFKAHDDTPYDDEIPQEFRASEAPPPPYDVDFPDWYPHNPAIDLLVWALDQLE
jgi:hypothetical protein